MQEANAQSVLGNFDFARFDYHGVVSTFTKRDGKYFVRTDGPDGKLAEFDIKYTFGFRPLQQYLIEFPSGRRGAFDEDHVFGRPRTRHRPARRLVVSPSCCWSWWS